jgi:pilus assembly protein CpaB
MKNEKEKSVVEQMRQDRKILLISVLCGLVAVVLVYMYLKSKEEPYGPPVRILVTASDIMKGEAFTKESIVVKTIPQMLIPPESLGPDQLLTIIDAEASIPLSKGQPILWSYIQTERVIEALSEVLIQEHNERAVTIAVDEISGVAGHIQPNDRVDIIGTFTIPATQKGAQAVTKTKTILQCVTVLAVGTAGRQYRGTPASVTLKVKPAEAELLTFAEQSGRLRLLLRNPNDLEVDENIPVIDFSNLFEMEKRQTRARKNYIKIIYGKEK